MRPCRRSPAPSRRALARLARLAAPLAAALVLSACAGVQFQWANSLTPKTLERRYLDLADPMSPVNIWNVY